MPNGLNLTQVMGPLNVSLCPRFSGGVTLLSSPVIQESVASCPSWSDISGGHPWMPTPMLSSPPVLTYCSHGKASHQLLGLKLAGLFHPLSGPGQPWTHYVWLHYRATPSQCNTVILTIIDHFSKAVNFVTFPNSLQPVKPLTSWSTISSISTAFPHTLLCNCVSLVSTRPLHPTLSQIRKFGSLLETFPLRQSPRNSSLITYGHLRLRASLSSSLSDWNYPGPCTSTLLYTSPRWI